MYLRLYVDESTGEVVLECGNDKLLIRDMGAILLDSGDNDYDGNVNLPGFLYKAARSGDNLGQDDGALCALHNHGASDVRIHVNTNLIAPCS